MLPGIPVHGEGSHASDASSGVALTLFEASQTSSRTLASNEYLEITHISANMGGSGFLAADADSDGERAAYLASGVNNIDLAHDPYVCPKGVVPKVFTDAANSAEITIQGRIRRA